jgi:redox-sensitive bicupin YhaK (pirin superfamily)
VKVRVPLGQFADVRSPLSPPTDVTLLDVFLEEGAELALPVPMGHQAFVLPVMGRALLNGTEFGLDDLSVPKMPSGPVHTTYQLKAHAGNAKLAVFIGVPLQQAFFSNGPMAFASQEHLIAATAAYHRGEMGTL